MKKNLFSLRLMLLYLFTKPWQVTSWPFAVPRATAHEHVSNGKSQIKLIPEKRGADECKGLNARCRLDAFSQLRNERGVMPPFLVASTLALFTCSQIATLPSDISQHAFAHTNPSSLESSTTSFSGFVSPSMTLSSSQNAWMESLSPPTDEMPQIRAPQQTSATDSVANPGSFFPRNINEKSQVKKTPIIEGMVYMFDDSQRPDPSDVIVLTVASPSLPDVILAGAKYPVYKARMPFNFQLYDKNIVGGEEGEKLFLQAQQDGDLIIKATVCPEESEDGKKLKLPCDKRDSTYDARGLSKRVKVPGTIGEDVIYVRIPAALPLRSDS